MASVPSPRTNPGLSHPHDGLPLPDDDDSMPRPPGNADSCISQNYSMFGKIIISTVGVLFFVVFLILILYLYTRWCMRTVQMRRTALSRLRSSLSSFRPEGSTACGLDRKIVEALPIFTYKTQVLNPDVTPKVIECAVCLAEFQQEESCKLLPKCNHFFHVGCIDVWFRSHMTCPLCRALPSTLPGDDDAEAVSEQGQEAQRQLQGIHSSRNDIRHDNEEHELGDGEVLPHADILLHPRQWQQSFSDKSPCIDKQARQSAPTDVLSRCNDDRVTLHFSAVGGRSLSQVVIDVLRPQETSLAETCVSSLVSPHSLSLHPDAHHHFSRGP